MTVQVGNTFACYLSRSSEPPISSHELALLVQIGIQRSNRTRGGEFVSRFLHRREDLLFGQCPFCHGLDNGSLEGQPVPASSTPAGRARCSTSTLGWTAQRQVD